MRWMLTIAIIWLIMVTFWLGMSYGQHRGCHRDDHGLIRYLQSQNYDVSNCSNHNVLKITIRKGK